MAARFLGLEDVSSRRRLSQCPEHARRPLGQCRRPCALEPPEPLDQPLVFQARQERVVLGTPQGQRLTSGPAHGLATRVERRGRSWDKTTKWVARRLELLAPDEHTLGLRSAVELQVEAHATVVAGHET